MFCCTRGATNQIAVHSNPSLDVSHSKNDISISFNPGASLLETPSKSLSASRITIEESSSQKSLKDLENLLKLDPDSADIGAAFLEAREVLEKQESYVLYIPKFCGQRNGTVICQLKGQEIEALALSSPIEGGLVGSVFEIVTRSGEEFAMKIPNLKERGVEDHRNAILEEMKWLEKIHAEKEIEGIQKKPICNVYYYDRDKKTFDLTKAYGFISGFYSEKDLEYFTQSHSTVRGNLSTEKIVSLMNRLIGAAGALREKELYLTDLKTPNVFVHKKKIPETGEFEWIADIGDLSIRDTSTRGIEDRLRSHAIGGDESVPGFTSFCIDKEDFDWLTQEVMPLYKKTTDQFGINPYIQQQEKKRLDKVLIQELGIIAHQCVYRDTADEWWLPCRYKQFGRELFPDFDDLRPIPMFKNVDDFLRIEIWKMLRANASFEEIETDWLTFKMLCGSEELKEKVAI